MDIKNLGIFEWIKVGLGVVMLLCLLPMPYGFYNLAKFAAMVGFGILCYDYWQRNSKPLAVTFGCLAVLFQPFAKITLGRGVWQIVDVAVVIFIIVLLVAKPKEVE